MKNFALTVLATAALLAAKGQGSTLPQLLSAYYNIKDALVVSDTKAVSANATAFEKLAASVSKEKLSEKEQKILNETIPGLQKNATQIVTAKNIEEQRKYFQALSDNMFLLVESVKFSDQPVYQQYCPMKKAYWLSSEQNIKNPYYGKQMLNCGKVTKTLK